MCVCVCVGVNAVIDVVEFSDEDCTEDIIYEKEIMEDVSKTRGGSSIQCPDIAHGEPLTDRRSTFQAHLARVTSTEQVCTHTHTHTHTH